MPLQVVQFFLGQHPRGQVLVLDPLVGHHRRGQAALQVHGLQTGHILSRDPVTALPQGLELRRGHGPKGRQNLPGLGQKARQAVV